VNVCRDCTIQVLLNLFPSQISGHLPIAVTSSATMGDRYSKVLLYTEIDLFHGIMAPELINKWYYDARTGRHNVFQYKCSEMVQGSMKRRNTKFQGDAIILFI